jgi:chromosome segregation ATPase
MGNVPATATNESEAKQIGDRVQSYFDQLEIDRADLRRELELARVQYGDLDKQHSITEQRAERAERERDLARAQRDDALQKLVALSTLWGSIKGTIGQGEALINQTAGALKQSSAAALTGAPPRPRNHNSGGERPAEPANPSLTKIAEAFNDTPSMAPADA